MNLAFPKQIFPEDIIKVVPILAAVLCLSGMFVFDPLAIGIAATVLIFVGFCFPLRNRLIMLFALLPFSRAGLGWELGTGFGPFDLYAIWFGLLFLWRIIVVDVFQIRNSPILTAGWLMLLSFIPSAINTEEFVWYFRGLGQVFTGLVLATAVFVSLTRDFTIRFAVNLLRLLTIVSLFFSLYGAYQAYQFRSLLNLVGGRTFSFIFGDPNYYATFLLMALCLAIAFAYNEQRRIWRLGYIGIAATFVVSIIMTVSRSSYVVLLIVLICYSVFFYRYAGIRRMLGVIATVLVTSITVALFTTNVSSRLLDIFILSERISTVAEGSDQSVNQRKNIFIVGTRILQEQPVFGVGFGNFEVVFDRYREGELSTGNARAAHNTFLKIFAETGIFGFVFAMLFYGWLLWDIFKTAMRTNDLRWRMLLFSVFMAILSFFLMSVTLDQIYEAHFWVFAGIGPALAQMVRKMSPASIEEAF